MAEAEIDRLERSVTSLASSVSELTKAVGNVTMDVSSNRDAITKLHEAIKLMAADVEKHGTSLRGIELEAAKEEGRKSAMGDLQAKLREHDDAARDVRTLRVTIVEQGEVVAKLKQNHDQQKGFLIAVSVVTPIIVSLLIAFITKALGLG